MTELKNKMVRYGWTLVSENASELRMTRERHIEHMGDLYATQDSLALAKESLGKANVKTIEYKHYDTVRTDVTLTM